MKLSSGFHKFLLLNQNVSTPHGYKEVVMQIGSKKEKGSQLCMYKK